ncbi:MAG TPA: hypothetical protein VEZ20_08405 [Allosphingosinicella sp.]|jgi:hypothetical protein|nr:hypothetical protein [Allosphingosinicella sp.]
MSGFKRLRRTLAGALAAASLLTGHAAAAAQGPVDRANPTCPQSPNWSSYPEMRLTVEEVNGRPVLLAEGRIDDNLLPRLRVALDSFTGDEVWVRSPGGNARVGNEAGRLIREANLQTRIPDGWACFSACNFVFMGGIARFVDPGGLFIVHMFTHTGDRAAIRSEVSRGVDNTIGLIGEIEQQSALLASEDNDFLIRMGVSRRLLTDVMYQTRAVAERSGDRSTRRCLTQDEVRRFNVSTEILR